MCAFCLHPECRYELSETPSYRVPSSSINLVCQACSSRGDLTKFVHKEEISLGLYKLNQFLRPGYPDIALVEASNEETTKEEGNLGNKGGNQNSATDTNKHFNNPNSTLDAQAKEGGPNGRG